MGVLHRVRLALGLTHAKVCPARQPLNRHPCAPSHTCIHTRQVCVLVLGLPHAGQSSCITHFGGASAHTTQEVVDTPGGPKCEAHTLRVTTRSGVLRKLVALDFGEAAADEVAAQLQWQEFFAVAQAVLWVVDAAQPERLQHVQDALDRCVGGDSGVFVALVSVDSVADTQPTGRAATRS